MTAYPLAAPVITLSQALNQHSYALPATSSLTQPADVSEDRHEGETDMYPTAGHIDSAVHRQAPNQDYGEWIALVEQIRSNDPQGVEKLYGVFEKGIKFTLRRQLGTQEVDDKVHDVFLVVLQAIQNGGLREPERLMGFVHTVVRRQVASHIDESVQARREQTSLEATHTVPDVASSPEQRAIQKQKSGIMRAVLDELSDRDREVLTRFYLREESQEEICDAMNLSETQFRLLKSRAKTRFGELGKKKLAQRSLTAFLSDTFRGPRH